jgi:FkbM family methyltransferase
MRDADSVTRNLIEMVRRGFHSVGVDVRRHRPHQPVALSGAEIFKSLLALRDQTHDGASSNEEATFLAYCADNSAHSGAQLMQDLFVLYHLQGKRNGYFVEFGATDGVSINNTILLEREYGWSGVLAEPARFWHEQLRANRICTISTDCVWRASGETLMFNETPEREYSTIDDISDSDAHAPSRKHGQRYEVTTVSLMDLLEQAGAPREIDYLSVDTEGSELAILESFDFDRYEIGVITVEHNYTSSRAGLLELLGKNGFVRKFESLSQWDDWYVRA